MKSRVRELLTCLNLTAALRSYEQLSLDKDFFNKTSEEILETILSEEVISRSNNTILKRRREAKFSISNADIKSINYEPSRCINKAMIDTLSNNEYINYKRNILIFGATGTGKSYLANALGNNAVKEKYRVRFYRMSELLNDLVTKKVQGDLLSFSNKVAKNHLLIIDDFLLTPINEQETTALMELFEYVTRSSSIIITSQLSKEEWHSKLGGAAIADAILDRITSKSYEIIIKGDSLRKESI